MPLGYIIQFARPAMTPVRQQRFPTAAFQPQIPIVPQIRRIEQHQLVIAAKRYESARAVQVDEPVDYAFGIRSAIDVIAKGDNRIVAVRVRVGEKKVQRREQP